MIRCSAQRLLILWILAGVVPPASSEDVSVDFESQVAPILAEHCLRCHSPSNPKGDISLATFQDLADHQYVVAGDPDSSHLMDLVAATEGETPEMPKEGDPLPNRKVDVLRRWIQQGATWPADVEVREKSKADSSWWSWQPLHADLTQSIDDHIGAALTMQGLAMNPEADRRTLIRRATYDLIGLPPTPEEVESFVADTDPKAYEKLLDRLLQSPHYGERWGRHWLDIVRFGESIGYERNVIVNEIWPFRDYVIRSLNEDRPFDQFIREHLAGDAIAGSTPDTAVGTAFLVAGPYDDVGNQDAAQAAQIRANTLDEIISATGEAFLGVTLGCARCHDHKFDPITQEDYYGLYATFAGIRHGAVPLATTEATREQTQRLQPLNERKVAIEAQQLALTEQILTRALSKLVDYESRWSRPPVTRTGTEETFEPIAAKFVRLVCEAQDTNPNSKVGFRIDEFEVWSASESPRNVALASEGGKASGEDRQIEDFPGAYGPHLAIDGLTGAAFISVGNHLTIELPEPTLINRVVFSSARGEPSPEHEKFIFVAEYRIETSIDGQDWREVASGRDRRPVDKKRDRPRKSNAEVLTPLEHRLLELESSDDEKAERARLAKELAAVNREIVAIPPLPSVWIGQRVESDAKGPFHVHLGGSPQKPGKEVSPASLAVLNQQQSAAYRLAGDLPEAQRRRALADWIVHPDNPLTPRVLANRLWHYHFGTGIVDTPSDFGYMGGRPSHPELLDFLALRLQQNGWRIKDLHRLIMTSKAYRQSSAFRDEAAQLDGDARLLWRFPPRRLSAEEVRDTLLHVSGRLNTTPGGPGFRLYHFMQDNVCTYVPLEKHGPETYRRAVYHQNARASVVDLMTEFDQPDCTFVAPKRSETTTPLQALTMLNHSFTLDMASALAERLQREVGPNIDDQIQRAFQLCYARTASDDEARECEALVREHGLDALCRVLLNTSELIYVH